MDNIETALEALRTVEASGDYAYQQRVKVSGDIDTKVGAYGMLYSRFVQMAAAEGLTGADWRDPAVQDAVARAKLQRDYEQLGSWELAALAFRYGTRGVARLKDAGYITPGAIADAGYPKMAQYLRDIHGRIPATDMPVEGVVTSPTASQPSSTPTDKRSADIVRQHLRTMLNAQNMVQPEAEPETPVEVAP